VIGINNTLINKNSVDAILDNAEYAITACNMLRDIFDYVAVISSVKLAHIKLDVRKSEMDIKDYQICKQRTDNERKISHDLAISSVNGLNEIANRLGLEPIYVGGTDKNNLADRADIAFAIFEFTKLFIDEDMYGATNRRK
jgi:hypothetical protein